MAKLLGWRRSFATFPSRKDLGRRSAGEANSLTRGNVQYALYEAALKDFRIPHLEKSVLCFIIFRCHGEATYCWFSQTKAAKQLGICRTRFSEAVTWLRSFGYLQTYGKNGASLMFDLSPWATGVSPTATGKPKTCRPGRHITYKENIYKNRAPSARELETLRAQHVGSSQPFVEWLAERGYDIAS